MQKKHTVAVIGLGHWYWAYPIMGSIKTRDDVELKWLIGEEETQGKKASSFFNIPNFSLNYMDALEDKDVDIAIITTTTNLYEEIAVAAAKSKKNILIGKPIARTLAGADHIAEAIEKAAFNKPKCPVYQNVTAQAETDPEIIKANLVAQLTAPVRWTQSIMNMINDGADSFTEVGPGNALQGMVKRINDTVEVNGVK